jgi:hypothetical protein
MSRWRTLLLGGSRDGEAFATIGCTKLIIRAATGGQEIYLRLKDAKTIGYDAVFHHDSLTEEAARTRLAART